jgi:hypothetical protein
MSFSLFFMLALILHRLWRIDDPKGTAEWDEQIAWIGAYIILIGLYLVLCFALFYGVAIMPRAARARGARGSPTMITDRR